MNTSEPGAPASEPRANGTELPDRLSTDPRSPHYLRQWMEREIGVRFNGQERVDVEEYCISEGWIKVPSGKTLDRHGRPLLIKLKGSIEVYLR